MATQKTYYWLRLKKDFFNQREIKKLRKIAGGDTYTIIYLKMQLLSINNDGVIAFEGTEENLNEQLSIELDEEIDNVKMTMAYLISNNLIEDINGYEYLLNKVPGLIGSESDSAERVRKLRSKKKEQKALQCNDEVTNSNTEKEKEREKDNKDIYDDANIIFNHYKDKGIIEHRKMTDVMKTHINARIKEYGVDGVKEVIDRYAEIYHSDEYFLKYEWRIDEFMKPQKFVKFLEESKPFKRYKDYNKKEPSNQTDIIDQLKEEYANEERGSGGDVQGN